MTGGGSDEAGPTVYADLPGVTIRAWPGALRVRIAEDPTARDDVAVDAAWARMCSLNPRLFDGPILSVIELDPASGIVVRRDGYRRLAVQPRVQTGVEQLSVTGVMVDGDPAGAGVRVLLGRRGRTTRIYGGMWELGPSGGIDPPEPPCTELSLDDIAAHLRVEVDEEVGPGLGLRVHRLACVCHDAVAHSFDAVLICTLEGASAIDQGDAHDAWEYEGLRWMPLSELPEFDRERGDEIIAPTRALFRFLGWA